MKEDDKGDAERAFSQKQLSYQSVLLTFVPKSLQHSRWGLHLPEGESKLDNAGVRVTGSKI